MKKNAVISFSGGLDSTSLLLQLLNNNYKVFTLSFNYGQKHKIEIEFAKNNIEYLLSMGHSVSHKIIDITDRNHAQIAIYGFSLVDLINSLILLSDVL